MITGPDLVTLLGVSVFLLALLVRDLMQRRK